MRLILRNAIAFAAMVALCGALAFALTRLLSGIGGLLIAFAAVAACGVAGNFLFGGKPDLRAWLVFLAFVAFGAAMVVLRDPGLTFYPLLTSIPFAAVAAFAARFTAMRREGRRERAATASERGPEA
jgi:drug/metabolite transporter (DMT)-like permease